MSKVFLIIFWTDSNLFLIRLIFKCPKNEFLGCLDFVFFKKEKEWFSKFIWLLPLPSKASQDKLFGNLEYDSVFGLSLSKASFFWEILCQASVFRARIKLSTKILQPRVFRCIPPQLQCRRSLIFLIEMILIDKIVFHTKFL